MPPRIPFLQCLKAPNVTTTAHCSRSFTSTTPAQASTQTQKRRHHDPYAIAQAKARKAANLSRQEVLKKERAAALGDPLRGTTTPYVQSFDTAIPPEPTIDPIRTKTRISDSPSTDAPGPQTEKDSHLNFYLSRSELDQGVSHSQWLSTPSPSEDEPSSTSNYTDDRTPEQRLSDQRLSAETASEALRRISSLSLGSSKDRLRVNKQRCIASFGRHNTDSTLPPKPPSAIHPAPSSLPKTPRVGQDTGSSEVQIAILTAKIRALAEFLETRGKGDKVNKRNLRLLVHRRQKLLRYLERKERGGARFRNCVETLGLTEGCWKGEISL
ncbi:hypothetical protein LTR37_007930 [Vermiconidia calcicola]|uniref:Uncharacterized protein n=1 Tax=Vermiconidia calcicola TaxID=1690605 RepID=A0ACC3NCJ6_9PEZI|nr:hypothetical protein LTR37_007930 [Vermiconidia calcicola]